MAQLTGNQLLSVDEALARVLDAAGAALPPEDVRLDDALGRVLAGTVTAAADVPGWDNSAMDGYAVRAADVAAATEATPVRLRVVGESRAGRAADVAVSEGTAVRIATGAPIPDGADAIVPVEQTAVDGAAAERFGPEEPLPEACDVLAPVGPGMHVRRRGEDLRAGSAVLEPGVRLGPAHVALAAAAGAATLPVHRRPVAAILSTGDELRAPGGPLDRAAIYDSNRPMLLALCREAGFGTLDLGTARDSLDVVETRLRQGVEGADAVLVTGGVSVGPYDVVRLAFESIGEIDLWRVAVQPGKPFAFGLARPRVADGRGVLLFGMPGNPVSAFVTFELFVKPALSRLAGGDLTADLDRGVLEAPMRKAAGRRAFLRVAALRDERGAVVRDPAGRVRVREAGGQGSNILSALAAADALAAIPEAVESLGEGSEVEIRWLRR